MTAQAPDPPLRTGVLITAEISTSLLSAITSHSSSGNCSQLLFFLQHQKSQVISVHRSGQPENPALWRLRVPLPVLGEEGDAEPRQPVHEMLQKHMQSCSKSGSGTS